MVRCGGAARRDASSHLHGSLEERSLASPEGDEAVLKCFEVCAASQCGEVSLEPRHLAQTQEARRRGEEGARTYLCCCRVCSVLLEGCGGFSHSKEAEERVPAAESGAFSSAASSKTARKSLQEQQTGIVKQGTRSPMVCASLAVSACVVLWKVEGKW